ncbi:inositol phospholipid synthesis and fat-storage-inducing TM-domain-containing protein [Lyophyllum atratum]|nr:inositol phospholipid synthesis and fat-storage-inducing TM-domain-containing protein [Lyophyllum atratum]
MPDLRLVVFFLLVAIVASATVYSVVQNTYLDTSNPLLTHLPHPLGDTHYYANKANFLNVYFIKKAWAWTSAVFIFSWLTSPPTTRTTERAGKWVAETVMWLIFTSWFFGPALLERVILASGGECVLALPSGDPIIVPAEYCLTKLHLSPESHPQLFATSTFAAADWRAIPRLRRGHDISGHIFLLTMSTLFLADQLRYSFRLAQRSTLHTVAMVANVALIGIWLFATYTTSIYFHSPLEKVTGLLLGATCFVITLLPEVEEAAKIKKEEKIRQMKQSKD